MHPPTRPPDTWHLLVFAFHSLSIPQFRAASKARFGRALPSFGMETMVIPAEAGIQARVD